MKLLIAQFINFDCISFRNNNPFHEEKSQKVIGQTLCALRCLLTASRVPHFNHFLRSHVSFFSQRTQVYAAPPAFHIKTNSIFSIIVIRLHQVIRRGFVSYRVE